MRRTPEWVQSGTAVIITFEFFLYPLSILLLYFLFEGLARFLAGLITSEVVPSLPAVLVFKSIALLERKRTRDELSELPLDRFERLPGDKIRITSAQAKAGWNASVTISIDGRWYELEAEERASGQLSYVYLLRPAPIGKILRRIEHYQIPSAVKTNERVKT